MASQWMVGSDLFLSLDSTTESLSDLHITVAEAQFSHL